MRGRIVSLFAVAMATAGAVGLAWIPTSAALDRVGASEPSRMIGDGGQPEIRQGEGNSSAFSDASASSFPGLWEAGRTSAGDAAGPGAARGDDAGL
jgi:hypothetical protein